MSQFLHDWAARAQDAWLERESGPDLNFACKSCHRNIEQEKGEHVYRCYDCFIPPMLCSDCVIAAHTHNPFHRINDWDPKHRFWSRTHLGQLKGEYSYVLHIGHPGGGHCPNNPRPAPRPVTVIHSLGLHRYGMRFCYCVPNGRSERVPEAIQLIRCGLWPATWTRPETVTSMACLREHHILSLTSGMSTHDYVQYLTRTTDNVRPELVPVRPLPYRYLQSSSSWALGSIQGVLRERARVRLRPVYQAKPH